MSRCRRAIDFAFPCPPVRDSAWGRFAWWTSTKRTATLSEREASLLELLPLQPGDWYAQWIVTKSVHELQVRYQKAGYGAARVTANTHQVRDGVVDVAVEIRRGGALKDRAALPHP